MSYLLILDESINIIQIPLILERIVMPTEINFKDIKINFDMDNLQVCIKQMNYGIFMESYTKHCHGKNYYELHLVCGGQRM